MKLFIGSVLVFFLIIVFLFALFPSDMTVSRIIQINRSPAEVIKEIDDLRQWKKWNEFIIQANEAVATHSNPHWATDSASIDMGTVHIQLIKLNMDTVYTVWSRAGDSFAGNFKVEKSDLQTIVAWDLKFHIKWYPWSKLASMFYDKNLGPQMERSLMNLKNELEISTP